MSKTPPWVGPLVAGTSFAALLAARAIFGIGYSFPAFLLSVAILVIVAAAAGSLVQVALRRHSERPR